MIRNSTLDPAVLGRVLILQSALEAAPDSKRLLEMVARGLAELPGVEACAICLEGSIQRSDSSGSQGCPSRQPGASPAASCRLRCPFPPEEGWNRIELRTQRHDYGAVLLKARDPAALAPYLPFAANTANLVALHMENEQIAAELRDLNRGLDHQVREREATYRALVTSLPDVVARLDLEGRHLFVSDNFKETFGFDPAGFIGKTYREIGIPEPDCRRWEAAIQEVLRSASKVEWELTVPGEDSEPRVFNTRVVPECGGHGEVLSILAIVREMTAQRRLEQDYRTLFREILDGLSLHEVVRDARGESIEFRFVSVNPAFESITGLRTEEVAGKQIAEVFPVAGRRWTPAFQQAALTGGAAVFEEYLEGPGKHVRITVFRLATGHLACLVRDITEATRAEEVKARLEAQLLQVQKMESIGRLAGGIAHDFNNLLTIINGYSHMALSELSLADPLRPNLIEIQKAGDRAASLTRQLLAFSRKQVLRPTALDLDRVIEEMHPMLARLMGEDVGVNLHLASGGALVHADPHQLEQVIVNLAANARDAMPDGGTLKLETAVLERHDPQAGIRPGRYIRLTVSDSGVGMDEETRKRIFEPFFTTKDVGRGTGLGLSVVQGIVTQSGGEIEVGSQAGLGTTFTIYLPALAGILPAATLPGSIPVSGAAGETVLLVEDEAGVRRYAAMVMNAEGYRVIQAGDPVEALRHCDIEPGPIDLVLTDVVMPGMSGPELVRRIQQRRPGIKALFMSGYTDAVTVRHGIAERGLKFIHKPFTPKELGDRIRMALATHTEPDGVDA